MSVSKYNINKIKDKSLMKDNDGKVTTTTSSSSSSRVMERILWIVVILLSSSIIISYLINHQSMNTFSEKVFQSDVMNSNRLYRMIPSLQARAVDIVQYLSQINLSLQPNPNLNPITDPETDLSNVQSYVEVEIEIIPQPETSIVSQSTEEISTPVDIDNLSSIRSHQADIMSWMISQGLSFPNIELVKYEGSDEHRGLHAKNDLSPDDIIIQVPERFVITRYTAKKSSIGEKIISIIPHYDDEESSHLLISLFLSDEYALGDESYWATYIKSLPKSFSNMPVNYNEKDVNLLLESQLGYMYTTDLDKYHQEYDEFCVALPNDCRRISFDIYKWARLIVRSRAFSLQIDGHDETALIPLSDMINHDFDNRASWRFDDEHRQSEIFCRRPIKAGDPITITYGAKPNRVLLRSYGFALQDNPNREGHVYVQLPDEESEMVAKRVAKSGNPDTEFYSISHYISADSNHDEFKKAMALCRVAIATNAELDMMTNIHDPVSIRNEAAALRYLESAVEKALYKYTDTIDEDEKHLKKDTLSFNERNIIITRYSEKDALLQISALIDDLLSLLDDHLSTQEFNRRRFQPIFAKHAKYVRSIADIRRLTKV